MSEFKTVCGPDFTFDGNRAVHLDPAQPIPEDAMRLLIAAALSYHQTPRKAAKRRAP